MPSTHAPAQQPSRWGRFKSGTAGAITGISQSTADWFRSFTRRKVIAYVLVQLFTLGILSAYPLSALVLLSASAAMPLGLEIMFRLTGFILHQIGAAFSNRVIRPAIQRVTNRSNAPLGIGADTDNSLTNDPNSVSPTQILNALVMGDHARALRLVDNVNVNRTHDLMTLCGEAIRRNASTVFTRLLTLPEVQQHLADNNNRLLIIAARERRANMVTALLANQRVKDNAAASNNEALREACSMGSLEIVEALLACPPVVTNATFNHNEASRLAETNGHFDIVARLLTLPAVANYQVPRDTRLSFTPRASDRLHMPMNNYGFNPYAPENLGFADLWHGSVNRPQRELRNIANNRESAMDGLDANIVRELGSIQQRYQSTFQERGIDAILAEIRGFLIENYAQNPVRHNGRNLPLEFDRNLPNDVQALYYANKAHAAYRYLFLHPNPWISPNAAHTNHHANGGRSASISNDNKARIAYLWLAASDENTPLPSGSTRAEVKRLFAELILAGAGRGHNYDNEALNTANGAEVEVDDGEGDKPTCGAGTARWITQFVALINDDPESRPLSVSIIKNKFKAILVAEGGHAEAVFTKLAALNKVNLEKTKDALRNLVAVCMGDKADLEEDERALVEHLEPSEAAITAMVNECKTFFGEARITNRTERHSYQGKHYQSYEDLLRHLASRVLQDFYNEINAKMISLEKGASVKKGATTNKASSAQKGVGGKLVRFTPKKANTRASESDKENSDDHDAATQNKSTRRSRRV